MATGTATLDFGAFPGSSHATVAVAGQAAIASGSLVEAWLRPVATQDQSADEHMVETIRVVAADIVPGTGFTIHGFNTSEIHEPLQPMRGATSAIAGALTDAPAVQLQRRGGLGTRLYGRWTVAW